MKSASSDAERSAQQPGGFTDVVYDHDQGPSSIDVAGYTCAPTPLPAGSVVCREIHSGYVRGSSGPVLERLATFFSYDERGRLTRTYGPISLTNPRAADVPPLEERANWPDGAASERQGRLQSATRYVSPTAAPLVTTYDHDMFGVSRVTTPDGAQVRAIRDGRGRPSFLVYVDAAGSVRASDEEGREVRFGLDGLNRVKDVQRLGLDGLGNPTSATVALYQLAPGQDVLSSVTDGSGHPTTYTHDDFGRVESVSSETLSHAGLRIRRARQEIRRFGEIPTAGDSDRE